MIKNILSFSLKRSLVVAAIIAAGFVALPGQAKADAYYGQRTCNVAPAVNCPFGMTEVVARSGNVFCVSNDNAFCRAATTFPQYNEEIFSFSDELNFLWCKEQPRNTYASCIAASNNIDGRLQLTSSGAAGFQSIYKGAAAFTDTEMQSPPNDYISEGFECNNVGNKGVFLPTIPKIGGIDDYGSVVNLAKFKVASDLGFSVHRVRNLLNNPGVAPLYCSGPDQLLVGYQATAGAVQTTKAACVLNLQPKGQMSPCVIDTDVPNTALQGKCLVGTNRAPLHVSLPGGNTVNGLYYYDVADVGGATKQSNRSPGDMEIVNGDSDLCKKTAQDVMLTRSNTGCSTFAFLDVANNKLSATAEWDKCAKCIYGEGATIRKFGGINAQENQPVNRCLLYGFNDDPSCPAYSDGNPVTPDTEPFADAIPGALYTEFGCIGTSDLTIIVNTVIRIALGLMGGLVVLRIIQGALTMQGGSPEAYEEGRSVIISALVGLLVLVFSAAILNFLGVNVLNLQNFPRFG